MEWIVSGQYSLIVEADTQDEAIDKGLDKIGNGWEWRAEPVVWKEPEEGTQ